LVRKKYREL